MRRFGQIIRQRGHFGKRLHHVSNSHQIVTFIRTWKSIAFEAGRMRFVKAREREKCLNLMLTLEHSV
jgi:hypothetical protein